MATKRELKRIIKIHCAAVLLAGESMIAFENSGLSMEDFAYLDDEKERIALKILEDNPIINDAGQIVKAVCNGN